MRTVTDEEVITELRRIAAAHGGVAKAQAVVNAARNKRSVLHPYFDWDDSEAGESWRLHQARNLLRVVVMYEPIDEKRSVECRVFVSLTTDRDNDGGGYRVTHTVLSDPEQRRQLLCDARSEMKRFIAKYQKLDELAKVFAAMNDALD